MYSKEKKVANVFNGSWGEGYVTHDGMPNNIIGNILGIIEAIGLPQKQEEAIRGLIINSIWNEWSGSIAISSERHSEIRDLYYKKKKEAHLQGNPVGVI